MPYFKSYESFDLNNVDLNWYARNPGTAILEDNSYYSFHGHTYEDLFYVDASDGSNYLELFFFWVWNFSGP